MLAADYAYTNAGFLALAHRGGGQWEPNRGVENTMAAFARAVALGYRYIETDLQATRDGDLVCFHDPTLERLTGQPGRMADLTSAEVAQLRVGGEPIAFFAGVTEAFPEVNFNADLKTEQAIEPLVRLIADQRLADRILVDSFSQYRLSRFRALTRGRVPTAMAPPGVAWTVFVPFISRVIASPAVAVQVPVTYPIGRATVPVVTAAVVARVHAAGKVIHVWTIDDPAEMERLIDLGVDGIVTDRPDLLKAVLQRRGLWPTS